jgi:tRNA (mo5U34)-methyltransferase
MRIEAPAGFDVSEFYADVNLFQKWDVFPGHTATGVKSVDKCLADLGVPDRLDGLRVLEIAPWNGFFGFECLRRGADELVALGPDDPELTGFARTAQILDIGHQVRHVRASVYDIEKYSLGVFDVVMCLGLIYHLRHPLLAIDLLYNHCKEDALFLIDSATANLVDRVAGEPERPELFGAWEAVQRFPMAIFTRDGGSLPAGRDATNWFVPNTACLIAWVKSSGFEIWRESGVLGWHFIQARKIARPFVVGLEGYNPNVQRRQNARQPLAPMGSDSLRVKVSILAHLANVGDILGPSGFINSESDIFNLEGLSVNRDEGAIEYRVRFVDGSWSAWVRSGDFAGTRGQSRALTGFTIRLLDEANDLYALRSFGRFAGSRNPIEASDGQDCASASGEALCGVQVGLARRGRGRDDEG